MMTLVLCIACFLIGAEVDARVIERRARRILLEAAASPSGRAHPRPAAAPQTTNGW
jgi:hypothetical protein